jgi:hypothetical protein
MPFCRPPRHYSPESTATRTSVSALGKRGSRSVSFWNITHPNASIMAAADVSTRQQLFSTGLQEARSAIRPGSWKGRPLVLIANGTEFKLGARMWAFICSQEVSRPGSGNLNPLRYPGAQVGFVWQSSGWLRLAASCTASSGFCFDFNYAITLGHLIRLWP